MSNNFPKVSPDGRWIVFVQCRNGQLMRPDSQLYIVPFGGGEARRLRANTPLMNSWHSFSPNGRWLVFSSKARSPYTQMYLTHIDEDGNSSPAILIDNATAANRAVNIPEFVNTAGDGIEDIQVPAVDLYKLIDEAMQLEEKGENDQALLIWKKAVALDPGNEKVQNGLGISLYVHGEIQEAFEHLREAVRINPMSVQDRFVLGRFTLDQGHAEEALPDLQAAIAIRPHFESCEEALAGAYEALGRNSEALAHWRKALAIDSDTRQRHDRRRMAAGYRAGCIAAERRGSGAAGRKRQGCGAGQSRGTGYVGGGLRRRGAVRARALPRRSALWNWRRRRQTTS